MRDYAWGSRTHIPRLLGLTPDGRPWAELWLGAHPTAPSRLTGNGSLLEAIEADPAGMLGDKVHTAFGARLPFLMKLLAAGEPLSLQVHPTSDRARIRCAEQDSAGLPLDAAERSYPDTSHKPELVFALTRFEGMAGFRDPAKTAAILRGLDLPWLVALAARIETTETPFQTLRQVVTELLELEGELLHEHLQELRIAAVDAELRSHAAQAGRREADSSDSTAIERESVRVYAATTRLVDRYPDDPGVLVTLLLNHVVLAAGEAMFIDAGVIHAYTSGFGVEIMAASDNVLRAGLTPKHVDIPELLAVTNFTPMPPPQWAAAPETDGVTLFSPPVDEFELAVVQVEGVVVLPSRPQILLCLEGRVRLRGTTGSEDLTAGESAFVSGTEPAVRLEGRGRVALGRTP